MGFPKDKSYSCKDIPPSLFYCYSCTAVLTWSIYSDCCLFLKSEVSSSDSYSSPYSDASYSSFIASYSSNLISCAACSFFPSLGSMTMGGRWVD